MGGEYFPMARPNMPSVEVTRSGYPTAIVEWAACASVAAVSASVARHLKRMARSKNHQKYRLPATTYLPRTRSQGQWLV